MTQSFKLTMTLFGVLLFSCTPPPVPRPLGYLRIELPESEFVQSSPKCGPSFELPDYSFIENVKSSEEATCWFNVRFPDFNARLYCTNISIEDNLEALIKDAQDLVFSHELKASSIRRSRVINNEGEGESKGILYHLEGPVATPIQFFLTDSTEYFLRGSLYFDHKPNSDSTAPVIARLLYDIEHLMHTVSWE
jgi:gliding motility-associated lipoprotein GldD